MLVKTQGQTNQEHPAILDYGKFFGVILKPVLSKSFFFAIPKQNKVWIAQEDGIRLLFCERMDEVEWWGGCGCEDFFVGENLIKWKWKICIWEVRREAEWIIERQFERKWKLFSDRMIFMY